MTKTIGAVSAVTERINIATPLLSAASLCLALGCATTTIPEEEFAERDFSITSGKLLTEGVEIRAEDNSFTIRGGEDFKPPFYSDCSANVSEKAEPSYKVALTKGARRVLVRIPGRSDTYYGVLALCDRNIDPLGRKTSSYDMAVKTDELVAMTNGHVKVYYDKLEGFRTEAGRRYRAEAYTWLLWLSLKTLP